MPQQPESARSFTIRMTCRCCFEDPPGERHGGETRWVSRGWDVGHHWKLEDWLDNAKKMFYSTESRIENPKSRIENGPCQAGSGGKFPSDRFGTSILMGFKIFTNFRRLKNVLNFLQSASEYGGSKMSKDCQLLNLPVPLTLAIQSHNPSTYSPPPFQVSAQK